MDADCIIFSNKKSVFSRRWQEVEDLHVKKETIAKTTGEDDNKDNESDDLEEDDLEQFLDWRSKKSWQ